MKNLIDTLEASHPKKNVVSKEYDTINKQGLKVKVGKLSKQGGKYAQSDKRAGCNKQAGWVKMPKANKWEGWNKFAQQKAKISKHISEFDLLIDT